MSLVRISDPVLFRLHLFRSRPGRAPAPNRRKNAHARRFGQLRPKFRASINLPLLGDTLFLIFQSRFFFCAEFFFALFFLSVSDAISSLKPCARAETETL
jgi:hypothetical protein